STRVRDLGEAKIDAGGFRPEPRLAEASDLVRTSGNDAHGHGRSAIGRIDRISADIRIGKQQIDDSGKGVHQNAPLRRTWPSVSLAPPATATTATPISVFEFAVLVAS